MVWFEFRSQKLVSVTVSAGGQCVRNIVCRSFPVAASLGYDLDLEEDVVTLLETSRVSPVDRGLKITIQMLLCSMCFV